MTHETNDSIEQYHLLKQALNRLDELAAKEVPMKVIVHDNEQAFECQNCINQGATDSMWLFTEIGEYDYCPRCGQKLDWGEIE